MNVHHPKVKKILRQCERRIMKLTGRSPLSVFILQVPGGNVPYQDIEDIVCNVTGYSIEIAKQDSRRYEYRITRHLICFFARAHTPMSYRQIGEKINRQDHTTIMKAINRIKHLIDSGDPEICRYVKEINIRIAQGQSV